MFQNEDALHRKQQTNCERQYLQEDIHTEGGISLSLSDTSA